MSNPLEGHRGTSQFLDRRVMGTDGEMVDSVTRRPSRHTIRSVRMGLEAAPSAGNMPTIEPITPIDVANMSPKERARLDGKVKRIRKATRLNSRASSLDSDVDLSGLDEEIEEVCDDVVVDCTEEERIAYSSGDATEEVDATGIVQGLSCPISNPWEYCAAGSIKAVGSRALRTGFGLTADEKAMLQDQKASYAETAAEFRGE